MIDFNEHKNKIDLNGFTIIDKVFTHAETVSIIHVINDASRLNGKKITDPFAIRRFFKEIPDAARLILNDKLFAITSGLFDGTFFVVKSIQHNFLFYLLTPFELLSCCLG